MPGSLSQDLSITPKYVAVLHCIRQKHTKPHPIFLYVRLQKNDFWQQNATAAGTTQIWLACQMADPISYLGSPNMWPHEAWIGRNGRMAGFARDNSPVRSGTLRGSVTGLKACAGLCSFAQRVDLNPKSIQKGQICCGCRFGIALVGYGEVLIT